MVSISSLNVEGTRRVAVVGDAGAPYAEALRTCLGAAALDGARWYAERDVDHLEAAVRAGEVDTVIWPSAAVLLSAVWEGAVAAEPWLEPQVRLRFADGTGDEQVRGLLAAWRAAERRRRRGQVIGGLVLSLLAAGSLSALLLAC